MFKRQIPPDKLSARLDSDLLTELEAHEQELPMSLGWFRRARLLGGGPPYVRISNRIFYRRSALRDFVQSKARSTSEK